MEPGQELIEAPKKRFGGAQEGAGRPSWIPTANDLKIVEECGDAGFTIRLTCEALGISRDTFAVKLEEYPEFSSAFQRGKQNRADRLIEAAKDVENGLIVNATTPTKREPGGSVQAQSIFLDKMIGRDIEDSKSLKQGQEVAEITFRLTRQTGHHAEDA